MIEMRDYWKLAFRLTNASKQETEFAAYYAYARNSVIDV